MSDESRLILDRYKDLLTLDVPRRSVEPAECHDADASQHWRTRALRAEVALEEARAALRLATQPAPDDLLGWRLVNGCASLPDDTPAWVADLFREAWTAIRTLRADATTKAATIAAQDAALEEARAQRAAAFDRHAAETFEKVAALQAALEEATALTTAWNDGASAQTAGLDRDACPYPPDSDLGGAWLGGWTADAWQPGGRWHVDHAEDLRRHEATTRALSVAEDLVSRAIANAGHHRTRPLWSHVSHLFAMGATRAQDLCKAHGYDPDQEVGPSQRPRRMT